MSVVRGPKRDVTNVLLQILEAGDMQLAFKKLKSPESEFSEKVSG